MQSPTPTRGTPARECTPIAPRPLPVLYFPELMSNKTKRSEGHESDALASALLEQGLGRAVDGVEFVLDAGHLDEPKGMLQVSK